MKTIEEIKAALAQKKARKAELATLINGPEEKREKDLDKLQADVSEASTITADITTLEKDLDTALRNAAMASFKSNELHIEKPAEEENKEIVLDKRSATALALGLTALDKKPSDAEKRALNAALTTTATEYLAPTAEKDGVNNAGVFISTDILLDLLREKQKLTPILNAVMFTSIKGLTVFPYRASRTKASYKAEGKGTGSASWEFKTLTGKTGWLQINIDVTEESIIMSAFDLGAYILAQIVVDLTYDWSEQIIYGDGAAATSSEPAHIAGVVYGATKQTVTAGKELDSILGQITDSNLINDLYVNGSVVYLSRKLYNKIRLTKDGDGNYVIPPLNNKQAVGAILDFDVQCDDTLHSGDYVFGNVGENFKANQNKSVAVEQDKDHNTHVYSYNVSVMCTTIPTPTAFVYGNLA